MKVYRHICMNNAEVWVVNSNENALFRGEDEEIKVFEARVIQFIIDETIGNDRIVHEKNGAPFLENNKQKNISISHSGNWFALYVSENGPVGIDIQLMEFPLEIAEEHFLIPEEVNLVETRRNRLYLAWCAKEAAFKCLRGRLTDLKNDFTITSLTDNSVKISTKTNQILISAEQKENLVLAFTT